MRHEVLIRTSGGRLSIIIDDAFCQSLGESVYRNREVVSLFLASWISLLADSPLSPEMKPKRLYRSFLKRIQTVGLKAIILGYSDLAHELVARQSLMGSGTSIGDWIDDFKDTPVFFEYHRFYQIRDVKLLDFLYTFLNFGKKLDFIDESFNSAAFRSWLDVEERLGDLLLPEDLTSYLKKILLKLLPTFEIDDLRPKFGPGSVQERGVVGRIGKLKSLAYDPIIDRFLFHGHIGKYGMGEDLGISASSVIPDPSSWDPARGISSRISRLMFVPKNMKTARSICMEPNTLMFFQQGILDQMLRLIRGSEYRNFIDIRSQDRNRMLSDIGSYTGDIDTLDLSAASDSVSVDLVKRIFPPSWLIPMLATRTGSVYLPDGSVYNLRKFAPMGSALCFPTQCIIFASVCILASLIYTYETEDESPARPLFLDWIYDNCLRVVRSLPYYYQYNNHQLSPMAVYGDDICLDSRLTVIVKSILTSLGFTVNDNKSFCGSQSFRESCGGYYLDGHDITPLYFRIKGVRRQLAPEHVVSHVHLINAAFGKGYKNLYRFLRRTLVTWECGGRYRNTNSSYISIPYVSDPESFGIMVASTPKNNHLETR